MSRGFCPYCANPFERQVYTHLITCAACSRTFPNPTPPDQPGIPAVPAPVRPAQAPGPPAPPPPGSPASPPPVAPAPPLELEPESPSPAALPVDAVPVAMPLPASTPYGRPLSRGRYGPLAGRPQVPSFPPASAPPCARHSANPSSCACARCGDFICPVCATSVDAQLICVPCFVRKRDRGELLSSRMGFHLPTISTALGVTAMLGSWTICYGFVLGPAAIVTGIMALREIRRRPALPGENGAMIGIVTGAVGIASMVAVWLWIALRN